MATRHQERSLHQDLLLELYGAGVPMPDEDLTLLRVAGRMNESPEGAPSQLEDHDGRYHLYLPEYKERCAAWKKKYADREIDKEEWLPESLSAHAPEFKAFITSHIPRFDRIIAYEPFYAYIMQAEYWMADERGISNCYTKREKLDYGTQEYMRCRANKLYALTKYVWIKDAEAGDSGERKWLPSTPQAMLCFLFDCGYSFYLGKGRQAAITSTLGPCLLFRTITKANSYIKFITEDEATNKAIFEDKVRYTFTRLPVHMRPKELFHRQGNFIQFAYSTERDKTAKGAKLEMVVPSETAINGGSPSVSFVDEAASIGDFESMTREGNPTLRGLVDGVLKIVRQILAVSTGVPGGKGKGAFERALRTIVDKWRKGDTSDNIIPLFFDAYCRIGMTREVLEEEYAKALAGDSNAQSFQTREERIAQYRMHYPMDLNDMFMVSQQTLIPVSMIRTQCDRLDRVFAQYPELRPRKGYFMPVFGPMLEGVQTVVGATFHPTHDEDHSAPVEKFSDPDEDSVDRYWQGTDPLIGDTGTSNMASAILDAMEEPENAKSIYPNIACIVNHRDGVNIESTYEQCILMKLYYSNQHSMVRELVESNIGRAYIIVQESLKYQLGATLIYNKQLPIELQTGKGQSKVNFPGIDNHAERREYIIKHYLKRLMYDHCRNIHFHSFWQQARTFGLTYTNEGNEKWRALDIKKDKDDILFAGAYAFIGRKCFPELKAYRISATERTPEVQYVWRRENGVKYRQRIEVPVYV